MTALPAGSVFSSPQTTSAAVSAPWLPDLGDGRYRNPVLYADYSDPDAVRVGEDYWLTSSSFGHVPGLPILHSRDLVNWTLVNHALLRLVPAEHFSTPRHGQGVWAPSIRHHRGKFWIYYPDPDFGLYVITADDPRGAWSPPVLVKGGKGLIDPCPFWDDDGAGYLVHGWAKSRSGIKNRLTLHRLSADNLSVVDAGEVIIDGDKMPGWHTIEGPKLYKRGDYYYVFAPAGGVAEGYQAVFRSRSLYGPYENRIVLARGSTPVNGPHQGAWVDTPAGEHWFLHFQELPAYGRVVHLQPMRWVDDWPVMGNDPDGDGTGEPVLSWNKPAGLRSPPRERRDPAAPAAGYKNAPATSDEFDHPSLGLQWQWQANPQAGWFSLQEAPGSLRLRCVRQENATTFWSAGNLLLQKFPAPAFETTTRLAFSPAADGELAGLAVFGFSYAWLGLRRDAGRLRLVWSGCEQAHQGASERELAAIETTSAIVHLRVSVSDGGLCRFAYSDDGVTFRPIGEPFQATSSYWVGAKVGLFAAARGAGESAGYADFDWFRVAPLST